MKSLIVIIALFILSSSSYGATKSSLVCETPGGIKYSQEAEKAVLVINNKEMTLVVRDERPKSDEYTIVFTGKQKTLSSYNDYSCPDEIVETSFLQQAKIYSKKKEIMNLDFDCKETLYLSTLANVECP